MSASTHEGRQDRSSQELPCSIGDPYGLFSNASGRPLWPLADRDESVELDRFCRKHHGNAVIAAERSLAGGAGLGAAAGAVLSIGNGTERAGLLYAHLTGRRHSHSEDPDAVEIPADCEILVALYSDISYELLEQLYGKDQQRSVPGLVLGAALGELRWAVLRYAAAAALEPAPFARAVQFELDLPFTDVVRPDGHLFGGQADGAKLTIALASQPDIAVISANSDGVDTNFGSRILCANLGLAQSTPPGEGALCLDTGFCHRLREPLDRALRSEKLMGAQDLSGRAIIYRVCFGLLPRSALYESRFGLLEQIARKSDAGVIVTTWQVVFATPGDLDELVTAFGSGMAVGKAVARHNHSQSALQTGDRLCLLGDPRFHFAGAGGGRKPSPKPLIAPTTGSLSTAARLEFFRAYFRQAAQNPYLGEPGAFDGALNIIDRYAGLQIKPAAPSPADSDALVAALTQAGIMPCKTWLSLGQPTFAKRASLPCSCGLPSTDIHFTLDWAGDLPRRLLNCPRCGIVEDTERDAPPIAFLHDAENQLGFHMQGALGRWSATLKIEDVGSKDGTILCCAPCDSRIAEHVFQLPRPLPPRTGVIGLTLLDGFRLSSFRFPVKRGKLQLPCGKQAVKGRSNSSSDSDRIGATPLTEPLAGNGRA